LEHIKLVFRDLKELFIKVTQLTFFY
jgi:hypothetical protein